jgi:putative transposase
VLLNREGIRVNHKRVERIYREEGLSLRRKRKKRIRSEGREKPAAVERPNQRWSMDFMSDSIAGGRRFRTLNIIDEFTREALAIEVDLNIGGLAVSRVLERLVNRRGIPEMVLCDNGPEFTSRALDQWCYRNGVKLSFITPGKPIENCYIESFNGRFRDECLNVNWFQTLDDAKDQIEQWRKEYNEIRPHSSLNGITPLEFSRQWNEHENWDEYLAASG